MYVGGLGPFAESPYGWALQVWLCVCLSLKLLLWVTRTYICMYVCMYVMAARWVTMMVKPWLNISKAKAGKASSLAPFFCIMMCLHPRSSWDRWWEAERWRRSCRWWEEWCRRYLCRACLGWPGHWMGRLMMMIGSTILSIWSRIRGEERRIGTNLKK